MKFLIIMIISMIFWYIIIHFNNKIITGTLIKYISESNTIETKKTLEIIFFFALFLSLFNRIVAILFIPIASYLFRDIFKPLIKKRKNISTLDKAKLIIILTIYLILILL